MVYVNGVWYTADTIEDISLIIEENFHYDLARRLLELAPSHGDSDYYVLECECNDLENSLEYAEDEISWMEQQVEELQRENEELREADSFDGDRVRKILLDYFGIGDSYVYNLTRDKNAYNVGTMSLEDFKEFNDSDIDDLVEYIIQNY